MIARVLRLGGRGSKLSLVQAKLASEALAAIGIETEFAPIVTQGDRDRTSSLRAIGGQGVFVRAVESALLDGEIDVAVHSAKDVPPSIAEGTSLAAYLPRGDVRDALVSRDDVGLFDLPEGAKVGTGSRRRAAQLLRLRPDLEIGDIRGNVDTRAGKVEAGEFAAAVVAAAGLQRLGRAATEVLPIDLMMPSPGQGALVIQCRSEDAEQVAAANHTPTAQAVSAERAMLRALGAGCSLPLAALGGVRGGEVLLAGRLLSADGTERIEIQRSGSDPEAVGAEVAETLARAGRPTTHGRGCRIVSATPAGVRTVFLVGAGPGDPRLITLAGAEAIQEADIVLHDRLVSPELLKLAENAELVDVGKTPGGPSMPQKQIVRMMIERSRRGQRVVRLKGGDPFFFGRGGEEASALAAAGIPMQLVPGVSSANAAAAAFGIAVTDRRAASSVTVVTGSEGDGGAPPIDWAAAARVGGTIVVMMGWRNFDEIVRRLVGAGLPADTPAAAIEQAWTSSQRAIFAPLSELRDRAADMDPPVTVAIGAVTDLATPEVSWSTMGRRVVVTRAAVQADSLVKTLTRPQRARRAVADH